MNILIQNSTNENDIVLDPFGGSCPVAISCDKLNRKFICCEIDEKIYKMAVERFDNEKNQMRLF